MAGLLGVGGGLIIVPTLVGIFTLLDFDHGRIMHMALATSLATIVITSISSIHAHNKKAAVLWPVFINISPAILLGSFLGGYLATQMSTQILKPVFGLYAIVVAIQMFIGRQPQATQSIPGKLSLSIAGVLIGIISAIVGIGGGSMTVPYLTWNSISIHKAVATSAAVGLPIAVAGTAGYIFNSYDRQLPDYSLGYVYVPAFLSIIITSSLFAPLGAKLAHALPVKSLKKVFAVIMLVIGMKMLFL